MCWAKRTETTDTVFLKCIKLLVDPEKNNKTDNDILLRKFRYSKISHDQ